MRWDDVAIRLLATEHFEPRQNRVRSLEKICAGFALSRLDAGGAAVRECGDRKDDERQQPAKSALRGCAYEQPHQKGCDDCDEQRRPAEVPLVAREKSRLKDDRQRCDRETGGRRQESPDEHDADSHREDDCSCDDELFVNSDRSDVQDCQKYSGERGQEDRVVPREIGVNMPQHRDCGEHDSRRQNRPKQILFDRDEPQWNQHCDDGGVACPSAGRRLFEETDHRQHEPRNNQGKHGQQSEKLKRHAGVDV